MAGGLLQLVSEGQQNILLNGNPTKTFFKTTFARYTNFALQKFRVDFDGSKRLRLSEESKFTFKIPRYADLLMDCYVSITLPNIWSPIVPPLTDAETTSNNTGVWIPYEFRWIENIGAQMISNITITCGNQTLQEFSGDYLLAMVERDFNGTKRALFNKMIGNVPQIYDPANSGVRVNTYPNAYFNTNTAGAEPSIRGRTLYVPLNAWFNLKSQMAFPLTSLQYNELHINVTMRPIQELFQIRDVYDKENNYPYVAPNFNQSYMQFYRFLQAPQDIGLSNYTDTRTQWDADIHLNCTYGYLSNEESRLFALQEQKYLFKQVREHTYYNVTGPNKIEVDTIGMVSSFMFYLQRSDANLRNEWSNRTNWPYNYQPYEITPAPTTTSATPTAETYKIIRTNPDGTTTEVYIGPGVNANGNMTGWFLTGTYNTENVKNILVDLGLLLDGNYRENLQPVGVYNYIEKYTRTAGNAPDGLYCYNFCLNNSPFNLQPSGAINMSQFNNVELEFTTIIPSLDPLAQSLTICDPSTGEVVGINKPTWRIYDYNFNMRLYEERLNMVHFVAGNCGLTYAT